MNFMIYTKITHLRLNISREKKNILSDYQHHLLQDEEFSKPPPKLISNLRYKTNYIIHYRNWKFYLELGLCLTNVHVFSFDQLPWLENYINLTLVNVQLWKMILQKISLNNADEQCGLW